MVTIKKICIGLGVVVAIPTVLAIVFALWFGFFYGIGFLMPNDILALGAEFNSNDLTASGDPATRARLGMAFVWTLTLAAPATVVMGLIFWVLHRIGEDVTRTG